MGHRLSGDEEDGVGASSLRADGSKLLQNLSPGSQAEDSLQLLATRCRGLAKGK